MIEMLGVLAIIGVLTVGGIAAYTKAMEKYKLNLFLFQLNSLMNSTLHYSDRFSDMNTSASFSIIPFLESVNELPDNMTMHNSSALDIFNNEISITAGREIEYKIVLHPKSHTIPSSHTICQNALQFAKSYAEQLWFFNWQIYNSDTPYDQNSNVVYGDKYCTGDVSCLRDLTPVKINHLCNICETGTCFFRLALKK